MPRTNHPDYKKRLDPYDPRTGATGNDDPNESDADVTAGDVKSKKKRDDSVERLAKRAAERASPGSGEDEAGGEAADIQPEDVEQKDEPAR